MGFVARKQQQKNVLKYEVTGLAMLTGCALALGRLGYVGQFLAAVSIYLAGSWYFFIPILVGYAAIYMMVRRSRFVWDSRHLGLLILLLCILALIEMNFYSNLADQGLQNHFLESEWTALQELRNYIFAPTGTPPSAGGGWSDLQSFIFCTYCLTRRKRMKLVPGLSLSPRLDRNCTRITNLPGERYRKRVALYRTGP
ncbi:hypothetical protein GCM10025858_35860 [Alicyclobacillus sacchari]|uniref:DNA translocase FtsK 4TM domain-containing protein n=1 Tax=Alicyclobacillus sacchari TaxID=392010 RepID=UPI0023E90443|nr:DNA translocase FtsK 4TM domain-containing protein [Alicyclobacillus sacchari]GMA59083.1 hypothetical protein GCM10025858_35860 [Alicyclobacillus sacchari]